MSGPTLDFAVIGAGKCGTTSLYRTLQAHPQVFLPSVKETNFFALQGMDPDDGPDPEAFRHWPEAVTDPEAWAALYADAQEGQQLGEVCPMYLYSPRALAALAEHNPAMRLVVILRDPVDRLWSRHLHLVRDGRSPAHPSAIEDPDSVWWRRPDLIPEGRYATHLAEVDRWFPPSQVHVLFHEDLAREPSQLLLDLATFLQLEAPLRAPGARHNASGTVRSPALQQLIGPGGALSHASQAMPFLRQSAALRTLLERVRGANLAPSRCPMPLRRSLLQRVYREEIDALEQRVGRDLDHWKAVA